MINRLMITAVGLLSVLIFSCTSSSTPTQTQTNANYDSQFREQTRSAQQNYTAGGQLEGAEGDRPITIMLLSMETGNVYPGEDYYVYAVVDLPTDRNDVEYVWSVANGDVSEVPESERGRLTSVIEAEYASGGGGAPAAGGEAGAVGAGAGAGEAGAGAPPGAAPPSGFQRPGGGSPAAGGASGGGAFSTGGGSSGDIPPGGSFDENGQPQGRLEVPANPGTGGSPDAGLDAGTGDVPTGPVKGGSEDEPGDETKSEGEQVEQSGNETGSDAGVEDPGSEEPADPEKEDETALVFERRQVAGPNLAQEGEDPAGDSEEAGADDADDSDEDNADAEDVDRADASGPAEIAERISEGASSAGTMADDAVLAGEPEDFSSLSTQYERWKEGTGEFRRQPLGPYGDDAETESLESEESFEEYTFVTDEPYILWTPRMPGETTIYMKVQYKEEDLTEPTGLDVTVRLKDPSVELADDFPEIVRENEYVFIKLDGENIPSFSKGLFTLEYDFNELSFREAELGEFFDDAPDASLYYAQPDKKSGKVLLAIDTNTELVNLSGDGDMVYIKFEAKQDIGDMTDTGLQLLSDSSASYILDRNGENVLPQPIEYPVFRTEVTTPPVLGNFTRDNTPGTPAGQTAGPAQPGGAAPAGQAAGGAARTSGGGTPVSPTGGTMNPGGGRTIGTPENPTDGGLAAGGGIPLGPLAGGTPPGEGGVSGGLVPNEDRMVNDADKGSGGGAAEQEGPSRDPLAIIAERNLELTNAIRDANMGALTQALDSGADANWLDPATGKSALHLAVLEGNVEAVQLMIDHRADPNIRSEEGMSAFDYAEEAGLNDILDVLLTSPAGRR